MTERPAFVVVSADRHELASLTADLDRRFGRDYRVAGHSAPSDALAELRRLAADGIDVALILVSERLDGTSQFEFLVGAHELHPRAQRLLIVARGSYGPDHQVVRAMTLGVIDGHLFRPWRPRDRWLYLPISEALAEWSDTRRRSYEGFRIIGPRWSPRCHELRDLLSRIGFPFGFYDEDSPEGRALLDEAGLDGGQPVVLTRSGRALINPTNTEISAALGMRTEPASSFYDVVVVGAGPAGLAAAVYGASEGLHTLVVDREVPGGQAGTSSRIRNYLGFTRGISGEALANRAFEQAWLFGAEFLVTNEATGLRVDGDDRIVRLAGGIEVRARSVVIATGVSWRRLGVASLESLHGAGVFYGAAGGEARAAEGRDVYVIGAGNSAGQAAVHLSRYAASITIVALEGSLRERMSEYLVQQIDATPNIRVRPHAQVVDAHGTRGLERLTIRDLDTGEAETLPASALFVMIGAEPHTDWLDDVVERDERGYLLTGRDVRRGGPSRPGWRLTRPPLLLETSVPGVFAAGDVRHRSIKRVASAVGEGANAISLLHEYLAEQARQALPLAERTVAGDIVLQNPPVGTPADTGATGSTRA
jgi:thioredoxin reductase (NADPH)